MHLVVVDIFSLILREFLDLKVIDRKLGCEQILVDKRFIM